ncbi:hypothetical protein G3567_13065 [Psychroflexus sp. YR1-1]|uniref:Uncharacterized protein n=1 Tax=Psychroflexus aurantiacus TaxID=2709310 RepID=A0A6B3R4W2_9FLAO|nr:hypothetical protein [Psychroflexus aurantiacus]NEV95068.1 hypothetical protein [Psychroflexus aurantiacus]
MKKITLLSFLIILISSCNSENHTEKIERLNIKVKELNQKLDKKVDLITNLRIQTKKLQNQNLELENEIDKYQQSSDYYLFIENSDSEINVADVLKSGEKKIIDQKVFNDTLDISDNFFVYKHTSEIIQTSDSEFGAILDNFNEEESKYGNDFFVRVMTFYNGKTLSLEVENSNTDIHILIQPIALGYENKTFVISDFHRVEIISLEKNENDVELIFEHGRYPRKKESIIIRPELVKFKKNNSR